MRYLFWAFVLALTVIAVLFALSNRQVVELSFWPTPYNSSHPIFVWVMVAFVLGFFCGGFVAWMRGLAARRRERARREISSPQTTNAPHENRNTAGNAPSSSGSTAVVPAR
jgi:uncharacterized integral membrane protein